MVKAGMVKGAGFQNIPAGKTVISNVFAYKNAIQKVS